MEVIVTIGLKEGVLDPEGQAISGSLLNLGYQEVSSVTTGRQIRLNLDETDPERANQRVARMCETLLVNTVIETYDITISSADSEPDAEATDYSS